MHFIVIGSGGCVSLPKPLCQCRVCKEARAKGYPYARCGCSLYLHGANLLVDTPEDVAHALNHCDITAVDTILYSHWDPDHTLGMRVMEQLRLEWLDWYMGKRCDNPIDIYALPEVLEDVSLIRNRYGSYLDYYESMGLVRQHGTAGPLTFQGVTVSFVPVPKDKSVCVFVFEACGRKLVYAPCDCLPFPESPLFANADVLVIGNTFPADSLKDGKTIGDSHPLRRELHSMQGVMDIKRRYGIKSVIITHIEEDWGRSYDDYLELERSYENVRFAYDGMDVIL